MTCARCAARDAVAVLPALANHPYGNEVCGECLLELANKNEGYETGAMFLSVARDLSSRVSSITR